MPSKESRVLWGAYAADRKLRVVGDGFDGVAAGVEVAVSAVGSSDGGYRTRATTSAKVALRGRVSVGPAGEWDVLVGRILRRRFFADAELDRLMVVKRSSEVLAQTLLDSRVRETVRALAPRRLSLSYVDGAIAIEWAGVEHDPSVLDDVLDVLGYLAVRGPERTPYR